MVSRAVKLADGLYQLLWVKTVTFTDERWSSGNFEMKLTKHGVNECYAIEFSVGKNASGTHNIYLTITLEEFDETNDNYFDLRKVTARFQFCKKEMQFFSNYKSSQGKKIFPAWRAEWEEIPNYGCSQCSGYRGMRETFEILIDMDPTVSTSKQARPRVLKHLSYLWKIKTSTDVTFRCENRDVEAHTQIVASGSSVLAAMFQNNLKEKPENIFVIKETKPDVFETLLCFIYTGNVDFNNCDVAALLVAADTYNVDSLKKECVTYLSKNITLEKATNYLILSHLRRGAEELFSATLNYMQLNSDAICSRPEWANLLKNHLELGLTAIKSMVKKNVKENKDS